MGDVVNKHKLTGGRWHVGHDLLHAGLQLFLLRLLRLLLLLLSLKRLLD